MTDYKSNPNYEKKDGIWYLRRPNHDNEEHGYDLIPVE